LELILPNNYNLIFIISTFGLFLVAAIAEIGGGYLVWQWLRERKKISIGFVGGALLT